MYQAPAIIWNQIAQTGKLETERAKQMFALPPDEMLKVFDVPHEKIEAQTRSNREARAYLEGYAPVVGNQGDLEFRSGPPGPASRDAGDPHPIGSLDLRERRVTGRRRASRNSGRTCSKSPR